MSVAECVPLVGRCLTIKPNWLVNSGNTLRISCAFHSAEISVTYSIMELFIAGPEHLSLSLEKMCSTKRWNFLSVERERHLWQLSSHWISGQTYDVCVWICVWFIHTKQTHLMWWQCKQRKNKIRSNSRTCQSRCGACSTQPNNIHLKGNIFESRFDGLTFLRKKTEYFAVLNFKMCGKRANSVWIALLGFTRRKRLYLTIAFSHDNRSQLKKTGSKFQFDSSKMQHNFHAISN